MLVNKKRKKQREDKAWELYISKCPHCKKTVNIHHRSTISLTNLLSLIYKDLKKHYKSGNCCKIKESIIIKSEYELEKRYSEYAKSFTKHDINLLV